MCHHQPPCPPPDAPDAEAARTVADHHDQGWIRLCNGIIVFDDLGELRPNPNPASTTMLAVPPPRQRAPRALTGSAS